MSMNWLEGMNDHPDGSGQPHPMAMPVFAGQKLVVVGGSSGMGRQTAADVVAAGGSAVIIGQDQARVDDTVQTLAKDGPAYGIAADLADRMQAERVCQQLADEHRRYPAGQRGRALHPQALPRPRRRRLRLLRRAGPGRSAGSAPPATWPTPSPSCCPRPTAGSPAPSGTSTAASWPDATNHPPVRRPRRTGHARSTAGPDSRPYRS